MQTKLTLRLDKRLIHRVKRYTRRTGQSVSQMVANYFALLDDSFSDSQEPLPPLVQTLRGSLRGKPVQEADYNRYLEEKYR